MKYLPRRVTYEHTEKGTFFNMAKNKYDHLQELVPNVLPFGDGQVLTLQLD